MPASQKVTVGDGIEFVVEPVEDPDPVYYTDQSPGFNIRITNNDGKWELGPESEFRWNIEIDGREVFSETKKFGPLDHGESTSITVGDRVLAYEGHGVFGIGAGGATGRKNDDRWDLRSKKRGTPAYSFSVWDKSHYVASIDRPKLFQKTLIATTLVLIIFAAVQISIAQGWI